MIIERLSHGTIECWSDLVAESLAEGFRFLERLDVEWRSGANRFDKPGEALFLAKSGTRTVGICGLNVDPYAGDPQIGRVRHLYVAASHRRQGIGRALVNHVINEATSSFNRLTLRTSSESAAAFYRTLGFTESSTIPDTTHWLDLSEERR
jgi:ribosomal protein S18 acetylase RimI-like enzyme